MTADVVTDITVRDYYLGDLVEVEVYEDTEDGVHVRGALLRPSEVLALIRAARPRFVHFVRRRRAQARSRTYWRKVER